MTITAEAPTLAGNDNDTVARSEFLAEALDGLRSTPKTLPCKYFYDERGSDLFDQICELDEYYPTRTELAIMREHGAEMASAALGVGDVLVELGSGSSVKTRLLLDLAPDLAAYVPVDISREHLEATAERLRFSYPGLLIAPVAADYTEPFALPVAPGSGGKVAAYFPGSTIGNFNPAEAIAFLRRIHALCGNSGKLLVGIDLRKDAAVLNGAYNDSRGITAEFNLNLLRRINRELGGDFDEAGFSHRAFFNPAESRIEMHLVSRRDQTARIGGETIHFADGETMWTESSYKHTPEAFRKLAADAGFRAELDWTDARDWFRVQLLVAE